MIFYRDAKKDKLNKPAKKDKKKKEDDKNKKDHKKPIKKNK